MALIKFFHVLHVLLKGASKQCTVSRHRRGLNECGRPRRRRSPGWALSGSILRPFPRSAARIRGRNLSVLCWTRTGQCTGCGCIGVALLNRYALGSDEASSQPLRKKRTRFEPNFIALQVILASENNYSRDTQTHCTFCFSMIFISCVGLVFSFFPSPAHVSTP